MYMFPICERICRESDLEGIGAYHTWQAGEWHEQWWIHSLLWQWRGSDHQKVVSAEGCNQLACSQWSLMLQAFSEIKQETLHWFWAGIVQTHSNSDTIQIPFTCGCSPIINLCIYSLCFELYLYIQIYIYIHTYIYTYTVIFTNCFLDCIHSIYIYICICFVAVYIVGLPHRALLGDGQSNAPGEAT